MRRCRISSVARSLSLVLLLLLSACGRGGGGGDPPPSPPNFPPGVPTTYTVSGTVTGMVGTGMVLRNNGGDDKTINANGPFTFSTALVTGFPYSVTVHSPPPLPAQVCTVANGSGTISGNVPNVQVDCKNSIGGSVTGVGGT